MENKGFTLDSKDFRYCAEALPLCFIFDGKVYRGIPAEWNPKTEIRRIDCTMMETTVTGVSPEGLEVSLRQICYQDHDVCEYVAHFTNRSDKSLPIIENIRISGVLKGSDGTIWHGNGDSCDPEAFRYWNTPLKAAMTIEPIGDGTPCKGAAPYMRLQFDGFGYDLAIGWGGNWVAEFVPDGELVEVSVGQTRCRMSIRPGETMRSPSLVVQTYTGDEADGANAWRRWYFDHILPKQNNKPLGPKCCVHHMNIDGMGEATGTTETNQVEAIERYAKQNVQADIWWLDAGWYPCNGHWMSVGDWRPDPVRYPNGLRPVSDKCRENGIAFMLWFEPERAYMNFGIGLEHPEWLLHWHKDGKEYYYCMVDLGNPECCDYVINMIDQKIKEYGIDIYRQDCNIYKPITYWVENETEDRIGALENLYIQGYYRFWDSLLARNPGLIIDACAGGGRRNDIETMRRSVPLHYTDVGYGNHPLKCLHHQWMFEWIPYFRAHNMNWCDENGNYDDVQRAPDRFSYYAAMAPAITEMMEWDADDRAYALSHEMLPVWRKAAELMIGTDYYALTKVSGSSDEFYAVQFYDPQKKNGVLIFLNGATAKETEFTVKLRGLCADTTYRLTSNETKAELRLSGKELMDDFAVSMAAHTGDVWFYEGE